MSLLKLNSTGSVTSTLSFVEITLLFWSLCRLVLGLGCRLDNRDSIPGKQNILLSFCVLQGYRTPPPSRLIKCTCCSFTGGPNRSRCYQPSPSNAEVNTWSYASIQSYVSKAWCLIKHGEKSHLILLKYLHNIVTFARFKVLKAVFLMVNVFWDARLCRQASGSREESQMLRNAGNYLPNDITSRTGRLKLPTLLLQSHDVYRKLSDGGRHVSRLNLEQHINLLFRDQCVKRDISCVVWKRLISG